MSGYAPPLPTRAQRHATYLEYERRFPERSPFIATRWGPVSDYTVSEFHPDPARRVMYYLGAHRPHWLTLSPVPLFISAATLADYKSTGDAWPTRKADTFGCGSWALDSGAYTALTTANPNHPWHLDADDYGGMVTRFMEEIGAPPRFVAPQDHPCEPGVRRKTGATVRLHQEWTSDNFLYLRDEFPHVPWIPVLQGWELDEYLEAAQMYADAGVDLAAQRLVGLGSVCRRGPAGPIVAIVKALAARGYRLHGFGINIRALRQVGTLLASADSLAWSYGARINNIRLPECDRDGAHIGPCNNCFRYALRWREQVITAIRDSDRFDVDDWADAFPTLQAA